MPYYDYKCPACGNCFEIKQSFHDEPVATCPGCKTGARRMISAAPIIFKGSGFYVTDNPGRNAASAESKSTDKTDKKESPNGKKDDSAKEVTAQQPAATEAKSAVKTKEASSK